MGDARPSPATVTELPSMIYNVSITGLDDPVEEHLRRISHASLYNALSLLSLDKLHARPATIWPPCEIMERYRQCLGMLPF